MFVTNYRNIIDHNFTNNNVQFVKFDEYLYLPFKSINWVHFMGELDNVQKRPVTLSAAGRLFVSKLEELRGSMSLNAFAKKCGMSEAGMRKYFMSESSPTLEKMAQIANSCRVEMSYFLGESSKDTVLSGIDAQLLQLLRLLNDDEKQELIRVIGRHGALSLLTPAVINTYSGSEFSNRVMTIAKMLAPLSDEELKEILPRDENSKQSNLTHKTG